MVEKKLLETRGLTKYFPVRSGLLLRHTGDVKAVDGVTFTVRRGETVGIVGESGCGKSTLGRTLIRLYPPTRGEVFFQGEPFSYWKGKQLRAVRKQIQMIFQDPLASLNPRLPLGVSIKEPLRIHQIGNVKEQAEIVSLLCEQVGLKREDLDRYPHEFSGGQRQRACIARALTLNPKLLIADEAVSALDVSIQAQIMNLMKDLQEQHNLTYIFISHNLNAVAHFCDKILVMYLGRIVESADRDSLFNRPQHPYTQALISSIPAFGKTGKSKREILSGNVPSPTNPPQGCHFHPRCKSRMKICESMPPPLKSIGGTKQHEAACWLYE